MQNNRLRECMLSALIEWDTMYKLQLCSEILCVWYNNRVRYCLFPNKRVRVPGTDLSIQQRRGGCVYETFSGNIEREREESLWSRSHSWRCSPLRPPSRKCPIGKSSSFWFFFTKNFHFIDHSNWLLRRLGHCLRPIEKLGNYFTAISHNFCDLLRRVVWVVCILYWVIFVWCWMLGVL